MTEDWKNAGFGVYIHWPFCQSKCPYCDFNSHVSTAVDQRRWAKALQAEIANQAALTPDRIVNTVFFGGGTPSLMYPETVAAVLEAIRSNWTVSDTAEINLEANPTSVEGQRFQGYAQAGINRLSMGIQSLIDRDLKALGRLHTVSEARQAFEIARKCFSNVSFDLIYARQGQSLQSWRAELNEALSMAVDHLSLYQLTIESGTRFGALYDKGKLRDLPDQNLSSDLFDLTQDLCGTAGMPAYEVSNHARPGAECQHNLIYWRYGDYVGIGPGAHGRLTVNGRKLATESPLQPDDWLGDVETKGTAIRESEVISPQDQFAEYLMMSLRLSEGCDLERLHALAPERVNRPRLLELQSDGYLHLTNQKIIATSKGRLVLNAVLGEILAD